MNRHGEFIREGPAGKNELVYAHYQKRKEKVQAKRREIENSVGYNDESTPERYLDILAGLCLDKKGEIIEVGCSEEVREHLEAKRERERKRKDREYVCRKMETQRRRKSREYRMREAALEKGTKAKVEAVLDQGFGVNEETWMEQNETNEQEEAKKERTMEETTEMKDKFWRQAVMAKKPGVKRVRFAVPK